MTRCSFQRIILKIMAILGLFFIIFVFSIQLTINKYFSFFNTVDNKQVFNIFFHSLDSNRGSLVSEAQLCQLSQMLFAVTRIEKTKRGHKCPNSIKQMQLQEPF